MANQDSSDFFTEVSTESWTDRIVGSIKGIAFGLVFILVSCILLYWNEGRAVRTYEGLKEGSKSVRTVSADLVDSKNEGQLVHFSGPTTTTGVLKDPVFQLSSNGLLIARNSQILQWQEKEKTSSSSGGGGSQNVQKTYTYEKVWSDVAINSSTFHHPEGHMNSGEMKFPSAIYPATQAKVGAFTVPQVLISELGANQNLTVSEISLQTVDPSVRNNLKVFNEGFYFGSDPASPQIGDISIHFKQRLNGSVTLVGRQLRNTLEAFETKSGTQLFFIRDGSQSAQSVFKDEQNTNSNWTWGLRAAGFLLMLLGFYLLMRPLVIVADFFPIVGEIMAAGSFAVALLFSLTVSCLIIGLGWLAHRPVLGVLLLAAASGTAYYLIALRPSSSKLQPGSAKRAA